MLSRWILGSFFVLVVVAGVTAAPVDSASQVQGHIDQGNKHWLEGRLDAAQASYQQALQIDPDSATAHMKLAGLHLVRHELRPAVDEFQVVIGLEPENATAFIGLGMAYLHLGELGPAHAAFSEAIRIDPSKMSEVEPILANIEAKMPHPTPMPDKLDVESQYKHLP